MQQSELEARNSPLVTKDNYLWLVSSKRIRAGNGITKIFPVNNEKEVNGLIRAKNLSGAEHWYSISECFKSIEEAKSKAEIIIKNEIDHAQYKLNALKGRLIKSRRSFSEIK